MLDLVEKTVIKLYLILIALEVFFGCGHTDLSANRCVHQVWHHREASQQNSFSEQVLHTFSSNREKAPPEVKNWKLGL